MNAQFQSLFCQNLYIYCTDFVGGKGAAKVGGLNLHSFEALL